MSQTGKDGKGRYGDLALLLDHYLVVVERIGLGDRVRVFIDQELIHFSCRGVVQ